MRIVEATKVAAPETAEGIARKKLTDAAEHFEAMFLQEMLKPLQSAGADGEADKDASPGTDTMSSYGTEAMAGAIAKSGGLGVARQIVAKVSLERIQRESNLGDARHY